MAEAVVKDLLLKSEVGHYVMIKLATEGGSHGLNVSDVITYQSGVSLTLWVCVGECVCVGVSVSVCGCVCVCVCGTKGI